MPKHTLNAQHEILIQERLKGKNIREAADVAGFEHSYARGLFIGHRNSPVAAEYKRRKKEQGAAIAEETKWSMARLIEEYEEIYNKAKGQNDYRACNKILDSITKICGHDIKRHEISGKDGKAIELAGVECRFNFENMSADALAELLDSQVEDIEEASEAEEE